MRFSSIVIMSSILDNDPLVLDALLSFVLIILFVIFMLFLTKDFITESRTMVACFLVLLILVLVICVCEVRACVCVHFSNMHFHSFICGLQYVIFVPLKVCTRMCACWSSTGTLHAYIPLLFGWGKVSVLYCLSVLLLLLLLVMFIVVLQIQVFTERRSYHVPLEYASISVQIPCLVYYPT